jgi:hypothetical protein
MQIKTIQITLFILFTSIKTKNIPYFTYKYTQYLRYDICNIYIYLNLMCNLDNICV